MDASENHKSIEEQEFHLPADIVDFAKPVEPSKKKRIVEYIRDKSSTPGDGGCTYDDCLRHNRPASVNIGVTSGSLTDPAAARMGAIMKHGNLQVQTGHSLISQWESKYISQVLPFVIPFMVSGPDYTFHSNDRRWRRQQRGEELEAPWVSACKWTAGFARRCESQCRQDWTALPIIRSVNFRHAVETGNTMVTVPVWWKRGSGLKPSAEEYVAMAQKLCQVLWQGHVRYGNIRVPLNGDTTRLHLAEGLSKTEKLLARRIGYMAGHFPGTQQVRRLMGHRHWGARVNYGDCLFFTISPNERQSSWVLKLSRYRVNDPFLRYSDPIWTRLCGMDYPELAAKRRRRSPAEAGESSETMVLPDHTDPAQEILIDLPEYKIRQEATARDPLAAVEAHRLNICLRLA